jgi:hypothetical protein
VNTLLRFINPKNERGQLLCAVTKGSVASIDPGKPMNNGALDSFFTKAPETNTAVDAMDTKTYRWVGPSWDAKGREFTVQWADEILRVVHDKSQGSEAQIWRKDPWHSLGIAKCSDALMLRFPDITQDQSFEVARHCVEQGVEHWWSKPFVCKLRAGPEQWGSFVLLCKNIHLSLPTTPREGSYRLVIRGLPGGGVDLSIKLPSADNRTPLQLVPLEGIEGWEIICPN